MLKSTGIVRKVDDLGRITIPMELRKTMGIKLKDPIEIFVNGNEVVLRKYTPGCTLCNSVNGIETSLKGKLICETCLREAAKIHQMNTSVS